MCETLFSGGPTGLLTASNGQHVDSSGSRLSDGTNIWPNSTLLPLRAEGAELLDLSLHEASLASAQR